MLKKLLLATTICMTTAMIALPVQATPEQVYNYSYNAILVSDVHNNNEKFRLYILEWLKQDKKYPNKIAKEYCKYKKYGGSNDDFITMKVLELIETSKKENWSKSRLTAYFSLSGVSIVAGATYYCPDELDTFNQNEN